MKAPSDGDQKGRFGYRPYLPQLRPVPWGEDIWTVEGPEVCYRLAGVSLPCPPRMTVVRLADGKLWLHSPVTWSDDLAAALLTLGEVGTIVAPNTYHHVHVDSWARSFPGARVYASPDLLGCSNRSGWEALTAAKTAKWDGALSQVLVELGRFNEAVFFHHQSRTLILTDLMQTFDAARVSNVFTRLVLQVGGATGPVGGTSIEIRIAARGHLRALRGAVRQMLKWDPAGIILSHGEPFRTNGTVELKRAFKWVEFDRP